MKGSTTSTSSNGGGGLQLLSPTMQVGLRATATNYASFTVDNQEEASLKHEKKTAFDFDGFTLEAVRRRHANEQHPPPHSQQRNIHHGGSFHYVSNASSSGGSPRSPTLSMRASTRYPKAAMSLDGYETGSVRSMDEFDWNNRNTHISSASSRQHHALLSSMSSAGTRSKRMSMASSTTSSVHPNKQRAEVVMRGWLQRRRGRMIKRWKAQYCVLKSDNKLCLYASEDTVNGRLEGRFQLLRVTYHEKNGSFQMIGIGGDETPYKEEFRPTDDDGWRYWFQALRVFFDAASMRVALDRMPELSLVPGVDAALLREADDEDDVDGNGDFAHEVEEMIMRPYAHTTAADDRTSGTNTSSLSSTASLSHGPALMMAPSADSVLAPSTQRKASVINPTARRASIEQVLAAAANGQKTVSAIDNQLDEDDKSVAAREQHMSMRVSQRAVWSATGSGFRATSTSSATSSASRQRLPPQVAPPAADCPMIERDSQNNPVPILERIGSDSVVSNGTHESDGGFAWNRL